MQQVKTNREVTLDIENISDELYDALDIAFRKELEGQGIHPDVSWEFWEVKAEYRLYD